MTTFSAEEIAALQRYRERVAFSVARPFANPNSSRNQLIGPTTKVVAVWRAQEYNSTYIIAVGRRLVIHELSADNKIPRNF